MLIFTKFHNHLQRALPPTLGALLFFCAVTDAHAFGKKPVVVTPQPTPPVTPPPPSTPTPPADPSEVIRARWEGKARDGAAWSQYVFAQIPVVAPNLLAKNPADVAQFCPAYPSLSATDKKNFWVYLFSAITELESNFDPTNVYKENFKDGDGNYVMSVGLLQLSIGDAPIYKCDFKNTADIEDPLKNLDCGLRIMNKLVGANGQIAGKIGSSWAGGARYWSTLRAPKVTSIQGWTKAQRICAQ